MADEEVIDLDAMLAAKRESDRTPTEMVKYHHVRLYGQLWQVRSIPNSFAFLSAASGDPGGALDFLLGYIHPDERLMFRRALLNDDELDENKMSALLEALAKTETGHPTDGQPASTESSLPSSPSSTVEPSQPVTAEALPT